MLKSFKNLQQLLISVKVAKGKLVMRPNVRLS